MVYVILFVEVSDIFKNIQIYHFYEEKNLMFHGPNMGKSSGGGKDKKFYIYPHPQIHIRLFRKTFSV